MIYIELSTLNGFKQLQKVVKIITKIRGKKTGRDQILFNKILNFNIVLELNEDF